jgi:uncharacterized membrane protein YccC
MIRTLLSKTGLLLFIYFAIGFGIYGLPPIHAANATVGLVLTWFLHAFLWPIWLAFPHTSITL